MFSLEWSGLITQTQIETIIMLLEYQGKKGNELKQATRDCLICCFSWDSETADFYINDYFNNEK